MKILVKMKLNAVLAAAFMVTSVPLMSQETNKTDAAKAPVEKKEADPAHPAVHTSLAKQSQNPIASLISLPLQFNYNSGVGPEEGVSYNMLIEPVIPVPLGEHVNLVNRAIIPGVIHAPPSTLGGDDAWGFGDIQYQSYFTRAKPNKIIWGAGPVLNFPSASADQFGTGKWGAGIGAVALTMPGDWVIGALVNNTWSYAGDSARSDVTTMTMQYFINYNIPKSGGWYLSTSPTMTANWTAPDNQRWTVPAGFGVGKVFHIGKQHINAKLSWFAYPVKPTGGADWGLQFQFTFLFPKS